MFRDDFRRDTGRGEHICAEPLGIYIAGVQIYPRRMESAENFGMAENGELVHGTVPRINLCRGFDDNRGLV